MRADAAHGARRTFPQPRLSSRFDGWRYAFSVQTESDRYICNTSFARLRLLTSDFWCLVPFQFTWSSHKSGESRDVTGPHSFWQISWSWRSSWYHQGVLCPGIPLWGLPGCAWRSPKTWNRWQWRGGHLFGGIHHCGEEESGRAFQHLVCILRDTVPMNLAGLMATIITVRNLGPCRAILNNFWKHDMALSTLDKLPPPSFF